MNYDTLASTESINKTIAALSEHNFESMVVENKEDALARIKEMIPEGVSVMNGSSVTLTEIGYIEYLKEGNHGWRNLHADILAEQDKEKQTVLRKHSVLSDFYLGSAHSITETGEIVVASNSGSQLPHLAYTSPNIILVIGAQKITPTLADALKRIDDYVVGLEDARMKKTAGYGTAHSKTLILHKENPAMGRKFKIIIVKEKLGF